MTAVPKQGKVDDKKWRQSAREKPCLACGHPQSILHHVGHDKWRDDHGIPLCGTCHNDLHASQSEALWLAINISDLVLLGVKLWAEKQYVNREFSK